MAIVINKPVHTWTFCVTEEYAHCMVFCNEQPQQEVERVRGLWIVGVYVGNRSIQVRCCGKPNKRDVRKSVKAAKRHIKNS